MERIEYHDPFPDEFMAKLRRLYGAAESPDHDDFTSRLDHAALTQFTLTKTEIWLRRCVCPKDGGHVDRCEVGPVLANCEVLAETVETEFERIQNWYRTPRFAADPGLMELIAKYRTTGYERTGKGSGG